MATEQPTHTIKSIRKAADLFTLPKSPRICRPLNKLNNLLPRIGQKKQISHQTFTLPPTGHKGPNPKRTKVHLRKFHNELPGNSPLGLGVPDVPAPKLRAPGNGRPGAGVDEAPGHLVRRRRRIIFFRDANCKKKTKTRKPPAQGRVSHPC